MSCNDVFNIGIDSITFIKTSVPPSIPLPTTIPLSTIPLSTIPPSIPLTIPLSTVLDKTILEENNYNDDNFDLMMNENTRMCNENTRMCNENTRMCNENIIWTTKSINVVYDNDICNNEIVNIYYDGIWMRAKW